MANRVFLPKSRKREYVYVRKGKQEKERDGRRVGGGNSERRE